MATDTREKVLDVSELEPPEPLVRAVGTVRNLGSGEYLRLCHRREPLLLYPELERLGFGYLTREYSESEYQVFIWRLDDPIAESAARERAEVAS